MTLAPGDRFTITTRQVQGDQDVVGTTYPGLPGDVHVDEVERSLGVDLPRGDYETVAGLIIAAHGSLPEPDTTQVLPSSESSRVPSISWAK